MVLVQQVTSWEWVTLPGSMYICLSLEVLGIPPSYFHSDLNFHSSLSSFSERSPLIYPGLTTTYEILCTTLTLYLWPQISSGHSVQPDTYSVPLSHCILNLSSSLCPPLSAEHNLIPYTSLKKKNGMRLITLSPYHQVFQVLSSFLLPKRKCLHSNLWPTLWPVL